MSHTLLYLCPFSVLVTVRNGFPLISTIPSKPFVTVMKLTKRMHLSPGNSLDVHNGLQFTTRNRDNDPHRDINCASRFHGAWWYQTCHHSNLNGDYKKDGNAPSIDGMSWNAWKGVKKSLKFSQMKMRRMWSLTRLEFADLFVSAMQWTHNKMLF